MVQKGSFFISASHQAQFKNSLNTKEAAKFGDGRFSPVSSGTEMS